MKIEDWLNSLSDKEFDDLKYCKSSFPESYPHNSKENLIKFCTNCGCTKFREETSDFIDYTVLESIVYCERCGKVVNHWAFGYYDNEMSEEYLKMERKKKLERICLR